MALIDKIKRFFREEEKTTKLIEDRKLDFNQFSLFIDQKLKDNEEKSSLIVNNISSMIKELEDKTLNSLKNLELIDLNQRKEQEKIKSIVEENLLLYVANLKRLLDGLKNVNSSDCIDYINNINNLLSEFNRTSTMAYEKATILIGKELHDTRVPMIKFLREFNNYIKENQDFLNNHKESNRIKSLIDEISNIFAFDKEIDKEILSIESRLKNIDNLISDNNVKISQITKSQMHKDNLLFKEKRDNEKNDIEKKLHEIKMQINFKNLSRIYHSDKKKNEFIKEYSNNFLSSLKKDYKLEILNYIDDSMNIDKDNLRESKLKLDEYDLPLVTSTDMEIIGLEKEIKSLDSEVLQIKEKIDLEKRKKEKNTIKIDKLMLDIRLLSKKLFPEINIV